MGHRAAGRRAWWTDALALTVVIGGLVWAVIAANREYAAYGAMAAWVLLMALVVPRNRPEAAAWALALVAAGCAASAVGFFLLYRWAGWPVMAYVDAISTAAVSLQAVAILWLKCLRPSAGPGGVEGRGELQAVRRD
jgi:hypothetical protein